MNLFKKLKNFLFESKEKVLPELYPMYFDLTSIQRKLLAWQDAGSKDQLTLTVEEVEELYDFVNYTKWIFSNKLDNIL